MNQDWHFETDSNVCLFRAVGVVIDQGMVLVQSDNGEYALPGGHVKIGETAEETLIREFLEETGLRIRCKRMIWVGESFFRWGNKDAHGIEFYYLVESLDKIEHSKFTSLKDNCKIRLEWVKLENVKKLNIYPYFIKDKITDISDKIEHFIHKD